MPRFAAKACAERHEHEHEGRKPRSGARNRRHKKACSLAAA